jgi:hypothetical protein
MIVAGLDVLYTCSTLFYMTEIISKVKEDIPQEVQKNLELTSINDDIVWQEHKIGENRFYVVSRKCVNALDVSKEIDDSSKTENGTGNRGQQFS